MSKKSSKSSSSSGKLTAVQWLWRGDNGTWSPFDKDTTAALEGK